MPLPHKPKPKPPKKNPFMGPGPTQPDAPKPPRLKKPVRKGY